MTSVRSPQDVDRLIAASIREGPSLEYKRELPLDPRSERIEAMKDLSGMGNGGGGVVVIGVDADPHGIPRSIAPLTDPGFPAQLEDVVRGTIRPPLLATFHEIDVPGGFVLSVEVVRSPLGPYMVEALDQRRYFVRIGKSTEPMTEQQVRDAYFLAARGREGRAPLWEAHDLPISHHTANPWLLISALPEEPLTDVLDLPQLPRFGALIPPEPFQAYADFSWSPSVFKQLEVWGDGLYWEYPQPAGERFFRVHRDGAVGWATELREDLSHELLASIIHAQFLYLGWLWDSLPLRTPIELRVELPQLDKAVLVPPGGDAQRAFRAKQPIPITKPAGAAYRTELLSGDLIRAPIRHRILREVLDRIHQVFGQPRALNYLFEYGWLYAPSGESVGAFMALGNIVSGTGTGDQLARVCEDGSVERSRDSVHVGFVDRGVFLDLHGRALGVVRYALGGGLPNTFLAKPEQIQAQVPRSATDFRAPIGMVRSAPQPVAEWSQHRWADLWTT